MRCPRCGNEVQPGEVFCGQCGAPSNPQGPTLERDKARLTQSGHIPVVHQNNMPLQTLMPNPPSQMPSSSQASYRQTPGSAFNRPARPGQPMRGITGQNQQTGFYHGATEAFTARPDAFTPPQSQGFSSSSAQRSFPGMPQYRASNTPPVQIQAGNSDTRALYASQSSPGSTQQGSRPGQSAKPRKQQHSAIVPIIGICLTIAIISIIGLMTVIFTKPHTDSAAPTAVAIDPATTVPTATATPTAAPHPTAVPDAGFRWCAATCSSNNFNLEYPASWSAAPATTTNGVQFSNPAQPGILMTVKAPGPDSGNATAGQLLIADLQTNYATQPGYTAPAATQTATLGGETWEVGIAYYQDTTNIRQRVVIYITVHQGNIYIIEMQAPDTLFDSINNAYYAFMINRFAFLL